MQTIRLLMTTSATPKTTTATPTQSSRHKLPFESATPTESSRHKLPPASQEELDKKQMEAFLRADRARVQTPLQVAPAPVGSGCRDSAEFDSDDLDGFFDLLKAEDIDEEVREALGFSPQPKTKAGVTEDNIFQSGSGIALSAWMTGADIDRVMSASAMASRASPISPTPAERHRTPTTLMTSGRKANKTAVLQLIDDFYEYRDQRIEDIWDSQSEDNRMSKEWIRRQMTSSAYASASRAPNYWNGYVSKVQQELKEEDPHANLDDARAEIARRMEEAGCDAFKDFLSDSEKEDLRKDMGDERGKKHVRVRKTNLANMGDVQRNCDKVRVMLEGLRERCGVLSLAFIARGNIKDAARAKCLYTGAAADFLTDIFKISVVEFLWRYEAYCSMRDPIPRPPKSSIVLRREIVKLTEDGLKLITGRKDVKMFYKHYDYGIRYLLGVELVGLLDDAKAPINPTKITTLSRLQSTVDALVTSKMHWRKMTAAERSKHAAAMDEAGGGRLRDPKKSRGAHPAKLKETVDLSEDEGEEDVEEEGEDAVSNAGEDDDGEQEEEDEDEEDEEDEEEEEEEEDDDESAAAAKKTSAAAAKKTAGAKVRKARAGSPKTKPVRKATSARRAPKTKGVPKPKRATPKAKRATSKAKRAAPKATAGPPPPRPKPRPLVKTPAIEAEKENTAPR
ncbi:hypothetical protein C8F04DRAFT_1260088 [Mycena alexandri]|uniref:Uncharacterized protein n=1 Tax=Mycena alexandri TaxID=1745969 RepID=A0AAD6SXV9_9AGAR|nr:hypothetical protein C8F04DRAFT_1260088 [Mycena alexandri]